MNSIMTIAIRSFTFLLVAVTLQPAFADPTGSSEPPLNEAGKKIVAAYSEQLQQLREELTASISKVDQSDEKAIDQFLGSDALDDRLVKFVVLNEATPRGLAGFAQQGRGHWKVVQWMLSDPVLMKQMLIADGAAAKRVGRNGLGPAEYGSAMSIYAKIQETSDHAKEGVLQRLALAISLEHAVPITQSNPAAKASAPEHVDPIKRYLHYEKALQDGELDAAFKHLSTWELRMVVNGDEPDETLAWGRKMLRNYRPDHIYNDNYGWRYVSIVGSDVKYGSGDVKYDRSELQKYQNILMNGGVCGRRAFFGRFILRAFGIPTIARPSRGHAALAHWTPKGWVVNLGGGWGAGWTKTKYKSDKDFLATTQARANAAEFVKVKRAQWTGDVLGEQRTYGEKDGDHAFWNGIALRKQRNIIKQSSAVTLAALGEDLAESSEPTVAEKIMASPVTPADKKITSKADGTILIPAAAYIKPKGNTRDVIAMKNFNGGLQVFLPRFFPKGLTVMRGGTWKGEPDACTSGKRLLSGGYGKYENWGLRAAITARPGETKPELKLDLGDGLSMEFVFIQPGTFMMGGESKTEGRFQCMELPVHEVEITKGFYLGKYEVTQAQYQAIMSTNPSKSTKAPDCPVDNIGEADAHEFCQKLAGRSGREVRLPTEAEWEYASRAGQTGQWFFGDDPSKIGQYAWFKGNANAKSHPVGQKKPNPWGLFDIYGNVCERISDKYAKNYYAKSPRKDPTGPSPGTSSNLEYKVNVSAAGEYLLSASVVTANYDQRLNVAVNQSDDFKVMSMPFTEGSWKTCQSVKLTLKKGDNTLRFWRDEPPQYGLAVESFTLKPSR